MIRIYLSTLFVLFTCYCSAQVKVTNLLCEHKPSPDGVDANAPSFCWQISATQRNYLQSAYQIQIADDSTTLQKQPANIIKSNLSIYKGKKLLPAHRYYWRVKVWDQHKQPSGWSNISTFTTGITDWSNAKWIGYEELPDSMLLVPGVHSGEEKINNKNKAKQRSVVPLFRKTFTTKNNIKSALVFISGLGQYELNINGKKVGDNFLAPGWTYYDKRVLYNTYDITGLLNSGNNAIGVIVGNGFYNINKERYRKLSIAFGMPKMICKLFITYEDGTTNTIVSGNDWKTAPSPITFASIYGGEDYNANLEQKDWDQPSFHDETWKNALLVKPPQGLLEAEKDYPVKVTDILPVQSISKPVDSIYMYDFGQNASGIIELKVQGHKGQIIKLTPAELINDKKLANQKATGKQYYYSYTLKGEGVETWRPRFTYYGFRYVQVEGATPDTAKQNDLPKIKALSFLHTRNSTPSSGTFECSNTLFNKINTLILWAIKSNMQSVVTDCPHREKLSWLEQDYLMGTSIQHNFDIYQLYKKLVYDMIDAQTKEGLVPDIAPEFVVFNDGGFGFRDSPEWGSASVILPWLIYKWYGDKDVMRAAYPMMKRYVEYLKSRSDSNILSYGLGDWYDYGPARPGVAQLTPKSLTATAIYYYDISLLSKMSTLLGNNDVAKWTQLAAAVKQSFNKKFLHADVYATGSQTAMAMPLCTGLVNEKDRKQVFKNMVDSITHEGKKLTAGDIGFHFLVQALQQGGASQLIYDMNYRSDVPGYGFQLAKGATALTESWAALAEVSNNHLMLGHIMEWFYNGLAGINQSEKSVAYKDIIIRPEVVGDITYVKGSYNSQYGTIRSEWEKEGEVFNLYVQIPANTTATIYIPASNTQIIKENDKMVIPVGYEDDRAIIKTGSGEYHYVVR
ncbi:Alpha-L-rhamnosidase N-terminal domain-containing protein [Chitinophaga sp. YR573]|uniref:family 78 glycoside hydrolase catalytic domain n=1 Tax=Chitinophaga sp. YR573 TaxID=1881040 RepID=UPI0008BD766D|nr:family 78 glycoside hydrolase catalytic domain [Chitinophaga sp. YR573]SEW22339.1 Alpha-L-rhamnosidase N-terminal domain-containing protein [Chitinophaga sp. YR573]